MIVSFRLSADGHDMVSARLSADGHDIACNRLSADGHDIACNRLSAAQVFYEDIICTATAGVALLTRQKCPKATWGKPQDPDAPERPPGTAAPSRIVG